MKKENLKKIFESLELKIFLAFLTILGIAITIFTSHPEQKTDLKYEIMANTNVIDFNADVSKLEIIYDSTNLKEKNENLRIYTVKIVNEGNKDITNEAYDENDPIGIKINSGEIIEKPELIQTSSDYLKNNVKIQDYKKNKITFKSVILDQNEYFVIKLLVLHKKEVIPNIISVGKISGQKDINVVNSVVAKEETNFWLSTFRGNIWMQLLRFISSTLILFLLLFVSISISDIRPFRNNDKKKKKLVRQFKKLNSYTYTRKDDPIFERYLESYFYNITKRELLLTNEELLNQIYRKQSELKIKKFKRFANKYSKGTYRRYANLQYNALSFLIDEMINDGIIIKEKDKLIYNIPLKETLLKFLAFLKENRKSYNEINHERIYLDNLK